MNRQLDRLTKHARYIVRYPGVMPRAAWNYAQLLAGRKRLRGVEFALTYDCPGRCGFCSATRLRTGDRPRLTVPEIKQTLRDSLTLGALNINLTGGECLILPELPELIAACRPRSTVVSLATNGWPLDEATCENIARWGVSIVTISLDSADPATHDAGRGLPGLYDRIMRGVDLLHARGVEVFLCTILTKQNIANGDAEAMWRLAMEKDVMLTVNQPCPVGGWEGADVLLDEDERAFHRELITRPHVRWEGSSNYFKMGCPAGVEKVYISPYGDVMPCNFLHVSYGNVRERPLRDIYRDLMTKSPFDRIHDDCVVGREGTILDEVVRPMENLPVHPVPVEDHPHRDLLRREPVRTQRTPGVWTAHNLALAWRHRRVTGRLAKNYLRLFAGEKRLLRGVEFCLTYRCQLDCGHCLTKALIDPDRRELTPPQVDYLVDQLASLGAVFVNFTGGEPLLREDLFDILARATTRREMLFTLASNGLLLDTDTARRLATAGVAMVTMSLDGPDAASHDASRGYPGAFDALLAACEHVKAAGLELWLTTILTRDNAADGGALATAELAKKLGATLTVNFAYAVGNWRDRPGRIGQAEQRTFEQLLRLPHVRWEGSSNYLRAGCPAGSEKLYLTPYGDVMPCATIQRSFGNALATPLPVIWRRMGRAGWFDGRVKPCLVAQDDDFIREQLPAIQQTPGQAWDES